MVVRVCCCIQHEWEPYQVSRFYLQNPDQKKKSKHTCLLVWKRWNRARRVKKLPGRHTQAQKNKHNNWCEEILVCTCNSQGRCHHHSVDNSQATATLLLSLITQSSGDIWVVCSNSITSCYLFCSLMRTARGTGQMDPIKRLVQPIEAAQPTSTTVSLVSTVLNHRASPVGTIHQHTLSWLMRCGEKNSYRLEFYS